MISDHLQGVIDNFVDKYTSPVVAGATLAAIRHVMEVEGKVTFSYNDLREVLRPNGVDYTFAADYDGDPRKAVGACAAALLAKGIITLALDAAGELRWEPNRDERGGNGNKWLKLYVWGAGSLTDAQIIEVVTPPVSETEDDLFGDLIVDLAAKRPHRW